MFFVELLNDATKISAHTLQCRKHQVAAVHQARKKLKNAEDLDAPVDLAYVQQERAKNNKI